MDTQVSAHEMLRKMSASESVEDLRAVVLGASDVIERLTRELTIAQGDVQHSDEHRLELRGFLEAAEAENTKLREDLVRAIQLANTFKGKVCSMNLSEESYDGFDLARSELKKLESALQSESDKPTGKESQS